MKKSQLLIALCLLVLTIFAGCSNNADSKSRPDEVREEQWDSLKRYTIVTNNYVEIALPNARNDYEDGIGEDETRALSVMSDQSKGDWLAILDDFTDEEVELRKKVFQFGHEIITAMSLRHEITKEIEERYDAGYEELKEYFGININTEEQLLDELYHKYNNADELITNTINHYLSAIEDKDFETAYSYISINKSEDEYVKDMEGFVFLNDYQLQEYTIFSIEERGPVSYNARVGMKSTSNNGEDASILNMPFIWSSNKNMWIIDSERITEE